MYPSVRGTAGCPLLQGYMLFGSPSVRDPLDATARKLRMWNVKENTAPSAARILLGTVVDVELWVQDEK